MAANRSLTITKSRAFDATNPAEVDPGTVRSICVGAKEMNAVHAIFRGESAPRKSVRLFFAECDVIPAG